MQRIALSTTSHAVSLRQGAGTTPLQRPASSARQYEPHSRPRSAFIAASGGEVGVQAPTEPLQLSAHVVDSIEEISRSDWDACATGAAELNPFVQWDFLHCLEASRSVVSVCSAVPFPDADCVLEGR